MSELILRTRELTRRYGRTLALDRASLSVEKGQILGLVGRNGAGKTTLIRLISGQSRPTSGELALFGASSPSALDRARSRTGVMVETPAFYPYLTAEQNLEYYRIQRGIPGRSCVDEALELVRLTGAGKKKFKTFSLGMKQRLGLALALMNQPEFLLLDEPINGLDPEGIVEFRELLLRLNRERQTTILISSHILSELSALATHYAFIDRGRMLETISAADLRERCRDCLELRVDDAARAAQVLEEQLGTRDFEVLPQERLRLYAFLDQPQTVNRVLMEQGVVLVLLGKDQVAADRHQPEAQDHAQGGQAQGEGQADGGDPRRLGLDEVQAVHGPHSEQGAGQKQDGEIGAADRLVPLRPDGTQHQTPSFPAEWPSMRERK